MVTAIKLRKNHFLVPNLLLGNIWANSSAVIVSKQGLLACIPKPEFGNKALAGIGYKKALKMCMISRYSLNFSGELNAKRHVN